MLNPSSEWRGNVPTWVTQMKPQSPRATRPDPDCYVLEGSRGVPGTPAGPVVRMEIRTAATERTGITPKSTFPARVQMGSI